MHKFYKFMQLLNNNFFIDIGKHNLIQYINESKKGTYFGKQIMHQRYGVCVLTM